MGIDYAKLLNDKQLEAVETLDGPVLILAGAGSGKTRVITFRIANLLESGVPQSAILSMTFTNKASKEMAARIKELTRKRLSNLTISTFHAFGVSVLRECIETLGFKKNFTIYDSMDKQNLIKDCSRELGFKREDVDTYALDGLFSGIKTGRLTWTNITNQYQELYSEYQQHLKLYNAVDFDDLIVLPLKLFKEFPEVLAKYHNRYKYFMVDEFQDTSSIQFELIQYLCANTRNVCVVGDDDQSIYSWRGANFENILNFERFFPEYKEIMLEQNYRSTDKILYAANSLIANNKNRKEKKLWTGQQMGDLIDLYVVEDEKCEGAMIASRIKNIKLEDKLQYNEFGVLVRTNSLTRTLEEAFLAENIPYKVSGGMSFFQRAEVKDIISYLRIINNPDDDMNLIRIINTPRRGIGKKTIQQITDVANKYSFSLYSAISAIRHATDSPVPEKMREILGDFISLIEFYREKLDSGKKMADSVKGLVEKLDYWAYLLQENKKQNVARWKYLNVEGVINSIADFENNPDVVSKSLQAYLNRITILSRDDNNDKDDDKKVHLMTIHSAKGLEFDTVFLAGVETHIIPHSRSVEEDEANLEEERRLFYVAITRARRKLGMTSCRKRRKKGKFVEAGLSPFIDELPEEVIVISEEDEFVEDDTAADMFSRMKAMTAAPTAEEE